MLLKLTQQQVANSGCILSRLSGRRVEWGGWWGSVTLTRTMMGGGWQMTVTAAAAAKAGQPSTELKALVTGGALRELTAWMLEARDDRATGGLACWPVSPHASWHQHGWRITRDDLHV